MTDLLRHLKQGLESLFHSGLACNINNNNDNNNNNYYYFYQYYY